MCRVTNCPESKDDLHCDSAVGSSECATATSSSRPVEFHTTPNQPNISFKRDVNNRSFHYNWYSRWQWLDWDELSEKVMCHPCKMINTMGMLQFSKNADPTFAKSGFNNWKDSTRCFDKHESSHAHKEAVMKWTAYSKGINVATQVNEAGLEQQKKNRAMLLKILSTLRLACQGLAIRGHTEESSNFYNLLRLRCEDCENLSNWLKQKTSFVSHEIQNEFLTLMAHSVLRSITSRIRDAKYYSIIADEVTDQSRLHQLGVTIRWVDDSFQIHEDFIELYLLPQGDAETIFKMIHDTLIRNQLPINACRGQCYDGASVMAGAISGVSTRIIEVEARALFVHCLAHSLNLAVQDSVRSCPLYRDMLEYIREAINMIRASPKRLGIMSHMQAESTDDKPHSALRPLCPTRWTTRCQSIKSVLDNYTCLMDTFSEIASNDRSDAGTKAKGLLTTMEKFDFYFALRTGLLIFERTETLSTVFQSKSMTVPAAVTATQKVKCNLERLREDTAWTDMWESCCSDADKLQLERPSVPRQRRRPARFDQGAPPVQLDVQHYFKMMFYQLLDFAIGTISSRIEQPGLTLYTNAEETILSAANRQLSPEEIEGRLAMLCDHFGDDINARKLRLNLDMLPELMNGKAANQLSDVTNEMLALGPAGRLYAELSKLVKLLLVIPATSATAERSFSAVRRLKTYLRATMGQQRLNDALVLNIHRDETNSLDLGIVARDFVALNDYRREMFGRF